MIDYLPYEWMKLAAALMQWALYVVALIAFTVYLLKVRRDYRNDQKSALDTD